MTEFEDGMAGTDPEDRSPRLRYGLVRRLIAAGPSTEPAAYLVDSDSAGSLLHLPGHGEPLLLVDWTPSSADRQLLADRIRRLAAESYGRGCHIAVAGGPDEAREFLLALALGRETSLHHVREDRSVWSRGRPLRALEQAARTENSSARPLLSEEVQVEQERFRAAARAEYGFALQMSDRRAPVTLVLVLVCGALFVAKLLWADSPVTDLRMGAVSGTRIARGEWWRLWAGTLLHVDILHALANLWSLWSLGSFLERLLRPARFFVLYALAGLAGALLTSRIHPQSISIGASGAIFGLLGAMTALAVWGRRRLPTTLMLRLRRMMLPLIGINVAISLVPGIDALSHLGGGVIGLLLLPVLMPRRREAAKRVRTAWQLLAALLAGLMAACAALALAHGRPWELTRAPSLERVSLPEAGVTLLVPRGFTRQDDEAGTAIFGQPQQEPLTLLLSWRPSPFEPPAVEIEPALREQSAHLPPEMRPLGAPGWEEHHGRRWWVWRYEAAGRARFTQAVGWIDGRSLELLVRVEGPFIPTWGATADEVLSSIEGDAPARVP